MSTPQPTPQSDSELDELLAKYRMAMGNLDPITNGIGAYDKLNDETEQKLLQWADRRAEKLVVEARKSEARIYQRELDYYKKLWEQVVQKEQLNTDFTMVVCDKCAAALTALKSNTKQPNEEES